MMLTLSAPEITIVLGAVIPLLTGLLTKATFSHALKGVLTLALNAIAAMFVIARDASNVGVLSHQTVLNAAFGFVVSVAIYTGVYRPANITSSTATGKLLPGIGVGPKGS